MNSEKLPKKDSKKTYPKKLKHRMRPLPPAPEITDWELEEDRFEAR